MPKSKPKSNYDFIVQGKVVTHKMASGTIEKTIRDFKAWRFPKRGKEPGYWSIEFPGYRFRLPFSIQEDAIDSILLGLAHAEHQGIAIQKNRVLSVLGINR